METVYLDQYFGNEEQHAIIRQEICDFLEENEETYQNFVEDDQSFEDYLENMRENATFGGNIELVAFSKLKNYVIEGEDQQRADQTLHIAYHDWEHYSSVRNIEGPFTGLPEVHDKAKFEEDEYDSKEKVVLNACPDASIRHIRRLLMKHKGNPDKVIDALYEDVNFEAIEEHDEIKETDDTKEKPKRLTASERKREAKKKQKEAKIAKYREKADRKKEEPLRESWGHATRANQVILDLLKLPAQHKVYVISPASDFIFQGVIQEGAIYRQADIDPGVVQPLPYTVDRNQTIDNLKLFLTKRPILLDNEVNWLRKVNADCVICDAPFLPCAAASKAGIPAALSSNFTFDEVFMGLCEGDELDDEIRRLVKYVVDDYRNADLLIRLPGAIRIPSFDDITAGLVPSTPFLHKKKGVANGKIQLPCTSISNVQRQGFVRSIIDVPLVFRKYRTPREEVLEQVGIPPEIYKTHRILLLSFGGQLLANGTWGNPLPPGWICIVCAAPDSIEMPPGFYRAAKDAYVPDLTHACDVLLGKLGYGTCSECIGHSVPFVYVSRPQFIEEQGLLKLMKDQGSAVELSREDFENGEWAHAIISASKMSGNCQDPLLRVPHNGGEVAALNLEKFVVEWTRQKIVNDLSIAPLISDVQQVASCAST